MEKINFIDGEILYASQLNKIQDNIEALLAIPDEMILTALKEIDALPVLVENNKIFTINNKILLL